MARKVKAPVASHYKLPVGPRPSAGPMGDRRTKRKRTRTEQERGAVADQAPPARPHWARIASNAALCAKCGTPLPGGSTLVWSNDTGLYHARCKPEED